jgi:hypothetical protein
MLKKASAKSCRESGGIAASKRAHGSHVNRHRTLVFGHSGTDDGLADGSGI